MVGCATVTYAVGGRRETIPTELLLLHQGVVPNVNLAMAAGIEHRWDDLQLCWSPVLDHDGNTSVEGIAIAGDGAGIGGAAAAIVRGRIAARFAVEMLAPAVAAKLAPMATYRVVLAKAERGRAFLDALFRPAPQFRIPSGRHYRLPLRGGYGKGRSRCCCDRGDRSEPAQGLSSHRHGSVPGPALRPDRHRADGASAWQDSRRRSAIIVSAHR